MMLVPAAKKWPAVQMLCAGIAALTAIIGLSMDEMSDGDVIFTVALSSEEFLDEIDYDCGWKSFRVNYIYGEDDTGDDASSHWAYERYVYEYEGAFCENRNEFIDQDFCDDSASNGLTWLVCGIMAVICFLASLPAVWFRGKASILYVLCLAAGILLLSIGSFNWLFNDKCEDIEEWPEEEATFDTSLGPSMVLAFVSIFCAIIGVLVSSIHLIAPIKARRQQVELQRQQPRIQSHIVENGDWKTIEKEQR